MTCAAYILQATTFQDRAYWKHQDLIRVGHPLSYLSLSGASRAGSPHYEIEVCGPLRVAR